MIIQELTKKQQAQLEKAVSQRGKISEIYRNTGIARSTIDIIRWKGTASQETITKLFNYLNNVQ